MCDVKHLRKRSCERITETWDLSFDHAIVCSEQADIIDELLDMLEIQEELIKRYKIE